MVSRCVAKNLLTSASMLLSAALLVNTANAEEVTFKFTATVIHVYDDLGISGLEAGDQKAYPVVPGSHALSTSTGLVPS